MRKRHVASVSLGLAVLVASGIAPATRADEPAAAPAPATLTIPQDTVIEFSLDQKIKARKMSPGEKVAARVTKAVSITGVQVIAAGAPITAVVTDSRRKKAGYFRTAEGYVAIDVLSVNALDGTAIPIESVTPIEAGTKDKKFTWSAGNASLKATDTFLARVTRDTVVAKK